MCQFRMDCSSNRDAQPSPTTTISQPVACAFHQCQDWDNGCLDPSTKLAAVPPGKRETCIFFFFFPPKQFILEDTEFLFSCLEDAFWGHTAVTTPPVLCYHQAKDRRTPGYIGWAIKGLINTAPRTGSCSQWCCQCWLGNNIRERMEENYRPQ